MSETDTIADLVELVESKEECLGLKVSGVYQSIQAKEKLHVAQTFKELMIVNGHLFRVDLEEKDTAKEKEKKAASSQKAEPAEVEEIDVSSPATKGLGGNREVIDLLDDTPEVEHRQKRRRLYADEDAKSLSTEYPLSFLTYNVWFDNFAMSARMKEQLRIIKELKPTFLAFQELLTETYYLLR